MATAFVQINGHSFISDLHRSNPRRPSWRPMRVAMAQKSSYWAAINDDIRAHLRRAIPVEPPVAVLDPMHHFIFAAPDTTAPVLCIAACELVGGSRDQAIAAASALHVMHAASYIHEHLPVTDESRPKSPAMPGPVFGPNIELLMGDGLIPFGFEILSKSDNPEEGNSDRILRVIVEITRAIGSQGVIKGQYIETEPESDPRRAAERKEGEMHACGAACGAILGGGSEEEIEKLRKYGFYVGMMGKMVELKGELVEEMRKLALKELEYFNNKEKVEAISSFANV